MHQYENIESHLLNLLNIINSYISDEYKNELQEFLRHGEYGIVYEDLCEIIALFKIPITSENYRSISDLGKLKECKNEIHLPLQKFVKSNP